MNQAAAGEGTARKAARRRLDPDQVQRAMYLDFEGTAVEAPSLIGVLVDEEFVQYVFEPILAPAATAKSLERGGTCVVAGAAEVFGQLRQRIEREGRSVFAWSNRERDAIVELVSDPVDRAFWTGTVENATPFARAWKHRHHRDVVFPPGRRGRSARHALARYFDLVGYSVPRIHGSGNTAARIRFVRNALTKRGGYEALTIVQKNKWTNLLRHNRHDCVGLRAVVERIALDASHTNRDARVAR